MDFYTRLGSESGCSPAAAESLDLTLLKDAGVTVLRRRCLKSVEMPDHRIVSATLETGETIRASVFIEATYKGGLLPGISPDQSGAPDEGDCRVRTDNSRMFLSSRAGRVPFPKPAGYDPARYGLLGWFLNLDPSISSTLNYTTMPRCQSGKSILASSRIG